MELTITKIDNEQLSYKTRQSLREIIRQNTQDGTPFKLPKEEDLAKMLGVSRNVLRDALIALEQAGCVTRRRSIGTIANPQIANAKCRIDMEPEIQKVIEDAGYKVSEKILKVEYVQQQDECFSDTEDGYLQIDKLFFADDVPAVYCSDRIPGRIVKKAGEAIYQVKDIPFYNVPQHHCNVAYLMAHMDVEDPEPWLQEALQLEEHEPVLFIEDHSYNFDHEIVAHSLMYFKRHLLNLKFLRKSW